MGPEETHGRPQDDNPGEVEAATEGDDGGVRLAVEPPPVPGDASADAAVPAPAVTYAEIPNPLRDGVLLAHDAPALTLALAAGADRERWLYTPDPAGWSGLQQIFDLEERSLRRMIAARRGSVHRRLFWWTAALGLPFLVASLLGALGLLLDRIPAVGPAVGEFVGSAGSSAGGLPLGIAIAAVPSLWIAWWAARRDEPFPKPARSSRRSRPIVRPAGGLEFAEFLQDLSPLVRESRQLVLGRRIVSGDTARRLEVLLGQIYRLSRRHGIDAAASTFADLRTKSWQAAQPGRRLLRIIALRRTPLRISDLVSPYVPEAPMGGRNFQAFLWTPAGVLAALLLFFFGGVFRLGPDQVQVLRPNQVVAFKGSLDVLSLTQMSYWRTPELYLDTVAPVDGPGWFWTWPVPITQREQQQLSRRGVTVESFLGLRGDGALESVRADVKFSVEDTAKWVYAGRAREAEDAAKDVLSQLLADYLAGVRARREVAPNRAPNLTEGMKDDMAQILAEFVQSVNARPEIVDLGIHVDVAGGYKFASFSP